MASQNIEDVYPLSPLQEGMLFHSLYEPEQGVYVIQQAFTLLGDIHWDAFEHAWQRVVVRHAILRTAFAWKNAGRPLQVVGLKVQPPLRREDWSEVPEGERAQRWRDLLAADRKRGFDLSKAPLMRLTLVREEDRRNRFLWTRHHLLMDGWAAEKVMAEVLAIYEARREGRDLELPPCRPYRDYIVWLGQQSLVQAEVFWRAELEGIKAPTPLMAGIDRWSGPAGDQHRQRLEIPAGHQDLLRSLVRKAQVTLNTLAQGAWSVLLSRYSGEDEVVFGVTVSGRPPELAGVEAMVGLFINTLPARVDVRSGQKLLPWLRALQQRQAEMRQFEFTPLSQVQGWSEVPRHLPLFDTYMVFENFPVERELRRRRKGLEIRDEQWISKVNYPIVFEANTHLQMDVYYDSARFDAAEMMRLLRHVAAILGGFAERPDGELGDFSPLHAAERQQTLIEWQGEASARSQECLHDLVAEMAIERPDDMAVEFEGDRLTRRELELRAERLAARLRRSGVGPEVPVGVLLDRSLDLPVALLAILKAGGAYLPLDPALPRERLRWMLENSRTRIVVIEERLRALLDGHDVEVVRVDEWREADDGGRSAEPFDLEPDRAAYVIYTSGSTGLPKGVVNSHRAILNRLRWMQETFPLTRDDAVLQKTPFSFDASIWEIFLPLIAGSRLVVARPDGHRDPSYLASVIAEAGITVLQLVPSMLGPFLEAEEVVDCRSLRRVFCGGEVLTPGLADAFSTRLPAARLCNLYGPTECSIDAAFWRCDDRNRDEIVPIGNPIANTEILLLDRRSWTVPWGVAAELYLGGTGLARGYLGRADLTAERFVPHPLSDRPGCRLYRTGDVGRRLRSGAIEFLGRSDQQVKIRGYRIELSEIESVLEQAPGVRVAAVLARPSTVGDLQLVAYLSLGEKPGSATADLAAIRGFLAERLPEHMLPAAWVTLSSLPRTASGKLDRLALAQIEPSRADAPRELPRNQIDQLLAGIWEEVLGVDQMGLDDDFFALGGHSLLVTQVTARIRAVLGIKVRMRSLFEKRTLASLADHVQSLLGGEGVPLPPPLVPVPRGGALPLSFSQQRLWFWDQFEPGGSLYNLPAAIRLRGRFDSRAFTAAFAEIVRRHEILRTSYPTVGGRPVQRIAPPRPVPMPVVDLSGLGEARRLPELPRLASGEAERPFTLASGPILRLGLLRTGPAEAVLLFNLHHIAGDAWSIGVLLRELGTLYPAFAAGRPSPLPYLGIQYADFASWQREWLSGQVMEDLLRYWRDRLAGASRSPELPVDRQQPAFAGHRGARLPLVPSDAEGALAFARREGVTPFMVLLASLQILLGRYTGQEDFTIGTPIAGRHQIETEPLIGFFVNTLVLRTDLAGTPTVRELLGRVRETTLSAFTHQDLPFDRLIEELQPERKHAQSPLFRVMFGLQNAMGRMTGAIELPGLTLEPLTVERGGAKFDLGLALNEGAHSLSGFWEYKRDLFDAPTVARLSGHFDTLLGAFVERPAARLWELPLLRANERQQLFIEWNACQEGPMPVDLPTALAHWAAVTPDAVALESGSERLTYGALQRLTDQLGHYLKRKNVGTDVRVGLCVDRSPALVMGILGVLKAGGAYVPLDPSYPKERLSFLVSDAFAQTGASILLGLDRFAGLFEPSEEVVPRAVDLIRLDRDWPEISREDGPLPAAEPLPESLAYLIYTSGSTGTPKGAALTRRGLANLARAQARAFSLGPGDRVLQFSSLSFDLSLWEVAMSVIGGATLCLASREALLPGQPLARTLEELEISMVTLPPAAVTALPGNGFPALTQLVVGGEAWTVETARRWVDGRRLYNGYGPTEVTICASIERFREGDDRLVLGRPIPGMRFHVLDPWMNAVPIGVSGQLYIAGPGLGRGYLGRPELTAEAFLPDPFSGEPGERLYQTGDAVRHLPGGEIEFLGRIGHHQVKVRGFRIELGEIETALRRHPGVREAVVLPVEDRAGGKSLTAYVVGARDDRRLEDLRGHLRTRLPEYMVPAGFVVLDALPLLPSGKVDRRALAEIAPSPEDLPGRIFVAPRTPLEELLGGVYAAVLRLDRVGVEDDFFGLGGHSLLATQLISRVRSLFGVELPLRTLFDQPTVAGLAAQLETMLQGDSAGPVPALLPRPRAGRYMPLSFAQQRFWFIDQMEHGNWAYHISTGLRLDGALSVARLAACLAEIQRRHETLRTRFESISGEPWQVVDPLARCRPALLDLGRLPDGCAMGEARRLATVEARRPFDLARGPLLRVAVVRFGAERHAVLLTMHHIISDGWSMGVLVKELSSLYQGSSDGFGLALPELPIQYGDFAIWQREWLTGERLEDQLAYWRNQLGGASQLLNLPLDRPRPAVLGPGFGARRLVLSRDLSAGLRALSLREGSTLFMILLAAYQALLSRYGGQEDISIGTPIAGRNRLETEGLIGLFVNTLVLRVELGHGWSFRELAERVRETALGAYLHQELPFEKVVEEVRPDRALNRSPLFQAMFALQNAQADSAEVEGLQAAGRLDTGSAADFDWTLVVADQADLLGGGLQFRECLFDAATIDRALAAFSRLLESVVADPDRRISDLPLLGAAERHQLLEEWSGEDAGDRFLCVHRMFAQQAAQAPERIALVAADRAMSYGELDRRTDRLARHLRSLGVGPDARVAVLVERSPEMVVALLGVLKAGGAYVPLDPAYPAERLRYMWQDSGARVLLMQSRTAYLLIPEAPVTIRLDVDWPEVESRPAVAIDDSLEPGQAAYVIYTSGSTGRPKGVLIPHLSLAIYARGAAEVFGFAADDRVLQFAALSFDVAVEEIFPTLGCGAALVLKEPLELASVLGLQRAVAEEDVTLVEVPTAFWHEWAYQLDRSGGGVPPSLRLVLIGGEPALAERLPAWRRHGTPLMNVFGLTEVTVTSTVFRVPAAADGIDGLTALSIGRTFGGHRTYVVDSLLGPVPIGAAAELCLGGPCLARGYVGRSDLTAERFVPDPFSPEPGSRMYRTGDLARHLADGNLEFLGRRDQQLKVRGFRIEPAEIEAALGRHPAIHEASVVLHRDDPGRLVAYLVAAPGLSSTPGIGALSGFLTESLPSYMVPSDFTWVESLPLTPSGKVDRRALAALPIQPIETDRARTAPRNPVEETLLAIWAGLLGRVVGREENFFAAGGHSLLVTRVASRLVEAFGVELPIRDLFEAPTVAELAVRVERAMGPRLDSPASLPILHRETSAEDPLSFAQARLWVLHQLDPSSPAYNLPAALRLQGPLVVPALAAALAALVERHQVLRSAFPAPDGKPVQRLCASSARSLPVVDLSGISTPIRERLVDRLIRNDARRPFELAHGPVLRTSLLKLGREEHAVLCTMHHIVSDAWSVEIQMREIEILYQAAVDRRPAALTELAIQYADYSRWQREWLQGEVFDTQLKYWQGRLEGLPPGLDLPVDRTRPSVLDFGGAIHSFVLASSESAPAIQSLCRCEGATLFMVAMASFQALLRQYTRQTDVSVGTPIAGRNRVEIEPLIGLFVNTLVLRINLPGDPSFRELLARVREDSLQAYCHQNLPFEALVDGLGAERDLARTPLFQVMFTLQNAERQGMALPGLQVEALRVNTGAARFDLEAQVVEQDGALHAALLYRTVLFERTTVARMMANWGRLLSRCLERPEQRLSTLDFLGEAELSQVVREWNDTQDRLLAQEDGFGLHGWIEAQVDRTPDAIAVAFGADELTYRQLERRANQLAHHLRRVGVGPEAVVGVAMERSLEMSVALLGILKARAAYLPIDPEYPADRVRFMLADSSCRILLAQERIQLPDLPGLRVLLLDRSEELDREDDTRLSDPVFGAHPAYVIYTSGSTGRPKGAINTHEAIVNRLLWMQRRYRLNAADRVLQKTPFSFDVSVWELFWPLLAGARLVMALPGGHQDPAYLIRTIEEQKITTMHFVPSMLRSFLAEPGVERCRKLRRVIASGEALPPDLVLRFHELLPAELHNLYGPTEAAVDVTSWPCDRDPELREVPIGRPIANVRILLLDAHRNPVAIGAGGELHIGGIGLARGYLGRPDLTADRFVPDPIGDTPGARLYRTGDSARYDAKGDLVYLGRLDFQIKIRGFRVELGEIEETLAGHPAVDRAVVVVRRDGPGGMRLVAYVTLRTEPADSPSPQRLREFVEERLPGFMVPSALMVLEAIPLSTNGKLDRSALPAPEAPTVSDDDFVAPRGPVEAALARLWMEILGLEKVGVHANFFELGGDSILGIQMASKARRVGLSLTPRDLFQHPTIARLAAVVAIEGSDLIDQEAIVGLVPLTPTQIQFFAETPIDPHHFNQAMFVDSKLPLDVPSLAITVSQLVAHHDALRMRFVTTDGRWEQVTEAACSKVPLGRVSLTALPDDRRLAAIEAAATAVQTGFNLATAPLLRVVFFDLGAGRGERLLIVAHHLVVDGVSWTILLEDLETVYEQVIQGRPVALPPKTTSFKRWAEELRDFAEADGFADERERWFGAAEARGAGLPVDSTEGADTVSSARRVAASLDEEETTALLKEVPQAYGTQIEDALMTALLLALRRWNGSDVQRIVVERHGRENLFAGFDLTRTVGWFTSMPQLSFDLAGAGSRIDALKAVKERLRALPHGGIGFGALRHLARDREWAAALPGADLLFNYLGQVDRALSVASPFRPALEGSGPTQSPRAERVYLLELSAMVADGRLRLSCTYSENRHHAATIERLMAQVIEELRELIALCRAPGAIGYTASDFPQMQISQEELDDLISGLSAVVEDAP